MKFFWVSAIMFALCFQAQSREIEITMTGDMGFGESNQAPHPNYVYAREGVSTLQEHTSYIRYNMSGDIRFTNLETVVTERALSFGVDKAFKFQSHPNAVRHVIEDLGINLFSLANNHAGDYGREGLVSTYNQMNRLASEHPIAFHGLGTTSELVIPETFNVKGQRVAFLAIGIDGFGRTHAPATASAIGSLNYRDTALVDQSLRNLKNMNADLKIISVHFGTEGQVDLDAGQRAAFRRFVDEGGAHIVIGHHPHVVRPVEYYNGSLIAYSLGNFLLVGAADMGARPDAADYGLILKVKVDVSSSGVRFNEVRAIPIYDMQYRPYPMSLAESNRRLGVLNGLNTRHFNSPISFRSEEGEGVWRP